MNERIKEIRKYFGLNQTEFGCKIGVKQGSVAAYESGARIPLDSVILSICREFNVNETWLRTGEGEPYVQLDVDDTISRTAELLGKRDPFLEAFLEVYGKMSDSARSVMIGALEEIIDVYKAKKE